MSNLKGQALKQAFEKVWLKECKFITAVELDKKRFGYQHQTGEKNNKCIYKYDDFPLNKNIFQHIHELRVLHHPDDLSICDNFFGHDIKKILIWDKPLTEKYCDIQRDRNSLEEVYIYSRNGFDHLSIISPSCRKLEVQYYKMENAQNISNNKIYPSIEHLVIREGYFARDFNAAPVKQLCEFISRSFPNLKQLEMEFDYLNKTSFEKVELINVDPHVFDIYAEPKMFDALPPGVKGTIKFTTFKTDLERCVDLIKDASLFELIMYKYLNFVVQKDIVEKHEIHDGLFFESIIRCHIDDLLPYHPIYGFKGIFPARFGMEPFWFQNFEFYEDEKINWLD